MVQAADCLHLPLGSNAMQIGQIAKRAGVPIDTVRYYERHGLLRSRKVLRG